MTDTIAVKEKIRTALSSFEYGDLFENAVEFFNALGYLTERQLPLDNPNYEGLKETYITDDSRFSEKNAMIEDWRYVNLLFQISKEDMAKEISLFDTRQVDRKLFESYLFFVLELTGSRYTKTRLSQISREMNKIFPMPVMVLFRHGQTLTLSVTNRRPHKREPDKDVLETITLIKDVCFSDPHRAHIDILSELSFDEVYDKYKFQNLNELHEAWQKTLDTSVLNKNFYNDVAKMFTKLVGGERKIGSKKMIEEGVLRLPGNHEDIVRKEFAVRLIGRLLFCWFLKKKTSPANIPLISDKILSKKAVTSVDSLGSSQRLEPTSCGYYHSVLEPLFFEALNKKKEERLPELQKDEWGLIPFLNGGLFEPHRHDFYKLNNLNTSVYLNTLKIPDEWCKELLEIFEHYHFTIEENTPIEIEISVDPEMLGRIFENLLAEINPETGQTARKSTGSYYTPRAIVEYMTDESLKQYLCSKTGIDEQKISVLLSYRDKEADLTEIETEKVIDALEQLKILDPACGSGAFPMGILQKMILILQRIDPDSKKWLGKLLANIPDPNAREMMRRKLEGEKDLWNYTRKLGVIRSSIYGVDIQPIATEISKLRFFLSLVVDEKVSDNDSNDNRGILPLPNLEFKFVCANTLIGLVKGDVGIFESQDEIEKLKQLHTAYFSSYDTEKESVRKEFEAVQKRMATRLLEWKEVRDSETLRLAAWNPFSGESCGWFDMEWMFGIKDGFDIVIGNPPYIKEYTFREAFDGLRNSPYYQGKMDLWYLFVCHNIDLLKKKTGILCFIASNNWTTNFGASKMRNKIIKDTNLEKLIDFGSYMIFESSDIQTMIMMLKNDNTQDKYISDYRRIKAEKASFDDVSDLLEKIETGKNEILQPVIIKNNFADKSITFSNNQTDSILQKIQQQADFYLSKNEVAQGIVIPQDYINRKSQKILGGNFKAGQGIFVLNEDEKKALNISKKELELLKPYYTTKQLSRWFGNPKNTEWIIYTGSQFKNPENIMPYPNLKKHLDQFGEVITSDNKPYGLHRAREERFFKGEKIIALRKCVNMPIFTYTDFDCYVSATFYVIKTERLNHKYLTALLNSKLIAFWLRNKGKMQGNNYQIDKEPLLQIPIFKIPEKAQQPFITLVDQILKAKKQNPKADTGQSEREIDRLVYELYELTDDEIAIVEGKK